MIDTVAFTVQDSKDLGRVVAYLENLLDITRWKTQESEKSPNGGACCYLEIEIKVKEKWA